MSSPTGNLKPSIAHTDKYRAYKRERSQTDADAAKGGMDETDDEKAQFTFDSGNVKNLLETDDDSKRATSPDLIDDTINSFKIDPFVKEEFESSQANIVKFELNTESDVTQIEKCFEEFEEILKERKEKCLKFARNAVKNNINNKNNAQNLVSRFLTIDVEKTKQQLTQIGTQLGEKEYELYKEENLCINKLREFIYFEDYNNNATKQLNKLKLQLENESKNLENEKLKITNELNKVIPILKQAKEQLSEITKSDLEEFKSLRKPSPIIINVIKCVAMMVGKINNKNENNYKEWNDIRKLLNSKFIDAILKFNFEIKNENDINNRNNIQSKWLIKKNITYDRANQASKIAGKFVFWLKAQIDVSKIQEEIAPKEAEIEELHKEKIKNEEKASKLSEMITEVHNKAAQCRREMVDMIRVILTLQDEIKAARLQHAMSPRMRKKSATMATRQNRASTMSSVPINRNVANNNATSPKVTHKILPPTQKLDLSSY